MRNFTIGTYYGIITKAINDLYLMQAPYTLLRKNKKLLSLKVVLKKKSISVNWLRLTYHGNSLMNLETHLRNTGCLPLYCSPLLAASVGSAAVSLGSSCSIVRDICISSPGPCSSRSFGGSPSPQRLRMFTRSFPIFSMVGMLPLNTTGPCYITGGPAAPAVA